MPSKNMLPKGKRRHSVRSEYRKARTEAQERAAALQAEALERGEAAPGDQADELIETAEFFEQELTLEERVAANAWITTAGATGSKVAAETYDPPRYGNPYARSAAEQEQRAIQVLDDLEAEDGVRSFTAEAAAAGMRIDAYLAKALPDVSRARVQMLIEAGQVTVDGVAAKAKHKLKGSEAIEIEGEPRREPLRAKPEAIPLNIVYEDDDLAVVNKPAGMMVHAGSGAEEHNRGTLVNALLYHLGQQLSQVGGELRPGIVHRLDKDTSGLIVVAKNDVAHRKLGEMFSGRRLRKIYLALVHGVLKDDEGTVALPISRDIVRRTRMTTRRQGGRSALTHWRVLERVSGPYGAFTLLEVHIETGRTHQIRVHMQAIGHPVVGDTLYGAPQRIRAARELQLDELELERNFLHAAELDFAHPRTGKALELRAELPQELEEFAAKLRG